MDDAGFTPLFTAMLGASVRRPRARPLIRPVRFRPLKRNHKDTATTNDRQTPTLCS